MSIWSITWLRDATERAISTAAQTLLAVWGVGAFDLLAVDWRAAGGVALGAAALSLLKSLVAANVGDKGTAALLPSTGRHSKPFYSGEVI